MQEEERNIGAVTWETYKEYLTAGNGYVLISTLLLALLLVQGTQVMSNYWLVFWQEQQFHQPAGSYVRDRIYSFPDSRSSSHVSLDGYLRRPWSNINNHVLYLRSVHRSPHILCFKSPPSQSHHLRHACSHELLRDHPPSDES